MQLEAFHPYVAPEVIGCPSPLINQSLIVMAGKFCRATLAWTQMGEPMPLIDGVADYEIDVPSDAQLVTVRDVLCGSSRLRPAPMRLAHSLGSSSEPSCYNMASDVEILTVFPTPSGDNLPSIVARACFAPSMAATTLPDFIFKSFMEAITAGAKSRLMLMPGVAWSNQPLGSYYQQIFDAGVSDAVADEAHDRVPGDLFVEPRRFGF